MRQREHSTNAERQRAYRERQRAIRNGNVTAREAAQQLPPLSAEGRALFERLLAEHGGQAGALAAEFARAVVDEYAAWEQLRTVVAVEDAIVKHERRKRSQ